MEVSTKRPAPFLRQVVPVRKAVSVEASDDSSYSLACSLNSSSVSQMFRDPRFDDLSGEYKPQIFEKTYKFIDDIKRREKEVKEPRMSTNCGAGEHL